MRAGLHGSNIFLSEDISATQQAIFFNCSELCCEKKPAKALGLKI